MNGALLNEILSVFYTILKANFFVAVIIIISDIIEMNSNFYLFVKDFKQIKDKKNAKMAANAHTVYYFFVCLFVFIYDLFKHNVALNVLTALLWIIIMIFLIIIFWKTYNKYQGKEPNNEDDNISLD